MPDFDSADRAMAGLSTLRYVNMNFRFNFSYLRLVTIRQPKSDPGPTIQDGTLTEN